MNTRTQNSQRRMQNDATHVRSAFTLTEILVVLTIIVLMLALAVPAFNLMRGSRSVEGAENQISAMMGRARADAIGLQKPFGIMFYMAPDAINGKVYVTEVTAADFPAAGTREIYLELIEGVEPIALPPGVLAFTFSDGGLPAARDRYIGYNPTVASGGAVAFANFPLGGVILFDGFGKVITRTYGYSTASSQPYAMRALLIGGTAAFVDAGQPTYAPGTAPASALGFVLCDQAAFMSNADSGTSTTDPLFAIPGAAMTPGEQNEETWIDDNSTPLLVNRFNGTLMRAQ